MTHTLGVDIGTFESKGVIVDHQGAIVAQATRPHDMIVPQVGWAEHRADEDWWSDFVAISNELLERSGIAPTAIDAVACSAIGPCMLPLDRDGRPLTNAVLYGVDGRAHREVEELTARIGEDVLLDRCGNALTSQSVGPKILWLRRERPEVFAQTAQIVTSSSYLVYRLTGEFTIDHYTAANFSPLYDVGTLSWSADLADDIVDLDKLPRPAWSAEIVGAVTPEAAAVTGLAAGTPVTTGTVDAAAEAVSVGVSESGDMMMMYGSTIFIIMLVDERVRDGRLWYAPWLFEGQHASMAGLTTSGTLTHWFREHLARDLSREEAFPILTAEAAESPPGANGLLALPYFSGERTPIHDPLARGTFFGLNLTHTRGDMYRALLEGIAFGTNHVLDTYAELGQPPQRLFAVGGGTKNEVWIGATSDVSGLDQIVREKTVGASYGDAFLAALAIGALERGDIGTWNPVASTVVAEPRDVYAHQYRLFRRLYEQTKDIAAALGG